MENSTIKKLLLFSFTFIVLCDLQAQDLNFWSVVNEASVPENLFSNRVKPRAYKLFQLNETGLKTALINAPDHKLTKPQASSLIIAFPNDEGVLEQYRVVLSPVMEPALAEKYPDIKSYLGKGVYDQSSTIRFDFSSDGLHAMIIYIEKSTVYIDPVGQNQRLYMVYSRKNYGDTMPKFKCETIDKIKRNQYINSADRNADDGKLRTYKLALACTGEYAQHFILPADVTPAQKKARVLGAMNTLLNRTNQLYERDFSIHINLVANNDTLIFFDAATDPWGAELNNTTQRVIDSLIGNANYGIGHLVHKAANNGNSGCIGCVCTTGQKGSGYTSHTNPSGDPFVVDYTCHEMGHQFGGHHTFTFRNEADLPSKLEPGSGSTIMGYAGITGAATDIQPHSDDYFHAKSIEEISNYVKSAAGGGCASVTNTGNTAPNADGGSDYTIPKSTPFTLTGSGSDGDAGDVVNYTWEENDPGTSATTIPAAGNATGPLFRSRTYSPQVSRTFPILASILDGTNGNKWEVLPSVARDLNFYFTVRDNHAGAGSNKTEDVKVTVAAAGPFKVTDPNTAVTWEGGSMRTIKWDEAGSKNAPVNCANVKISMSIDSGHTFTTVLSATTPNDGKECVQLPKIASGACRIKVEAVGNIFFDISDVIFTIAGTIDTKLKVETTNSTHCTKSDGKATITIENPPAGITFQYAIDGLPFQNSNSFENLAKGNHIARARGDSSQACEITKDFEIKEDAELNLTISGTGTTQFCNNANPPTITLTASASGGSGHFSYTWPGGTKSVNSTGHHSVTVTDDSTGCKKSKGGDVIFVPVVCSRDPNDIIGPEGYGTGKQISKFMRHTYLIRFENDPAFATAPAQVVKINHPLDTNVNLFSLRLGEFGFGRFNFQVPANRTFYSTRLDMMDSLGVVVDVTAGIDVPNKQVFWIFESKDPVTGLPPTDGNLGFLPINDSTSRGEGFVTYNIKPADHTQSGDSIFAIASIVFDLNPPLETPRIFNTVDAAAPVSQLKPLPSFSDSTSVQISWSGQDELKGSGVRDYDLYVSKNGGMFELYQAGIADTVTNFTGEGGATYGFYTIATDNTGNREPDKTTAERTVTLVGVYEIRTVTKCSGEIGVQMRIVAGNAPGTSDQVNAFRFAIKWSASYNVDLLSPYTNPYNIVKAGSRGTKDLYHYQVFQALITGYNIPATWIIGGWVEVMTVPNTRTGSGTGTFTIAEQNFDAATNPSLGINSNNFVPFVNGVATGVNLSPTPVTTINISGCTIVQYNGNTYMMTTVIRDTLRDAGLCDSLYIVTNIVVYTKPSLGPDKTAAISCYLGSADITTLYNTSGYSNVVYNTVTPSQAAPGVYELIVTTSEGCKDTAVITVVDSSMVTLPTTAGASRIANRECTDAQGWTHYYNNNGTPSDYSDDIRLLSIKKNGNNIGSVGDGTFLLKLAATAGAGSLHGVDIISPLVPVGSRFISMNRYWDLTPTLQPLTPVGVRYYYNTRDLDDINGDIPSGPINHGGLSIYKLTGGNPDPTTNWAGGTAANYYNNSSPPSLSTWEYTFLGNNRHQAEFMVSSFSGGGAGAQRLVAVPVVLNSFDVQLEKDRVRILWFTSTEINSRHFLVQRSLDGNNFEQIAIVQAAGNSISIRNYQYYDISAMQYRGQRIYYRIAQVDIANVTLYTEVKSVKIPEKANEFVLLYNPVQQEAILRFDYNLTANAVIRVIDHAGRVILKKAVDVMAGTNQFRLKTGGLANGVYEVELLSGSERFTARMVKN